MNGRPPDLLDIRCLWALYREGGWILVARLCKAWNVAFWDLEGVTCECDFAKEGEVKLHFSKEWLRRAQELPEPEGCAHCGAIAGCCAEYPNCPGGPKQGGDMIGLKIVMDGDGAWKDLKDKEVIEGSLTSVARLSAGMTSGKSSVGFRIDLPDGKVVFAQTTMALFQAAAGAFAARDKMDEDALNQQAGTPN